LLDFWSNLLFRSGQAPPDATLADFDANLAPALDDALCPYLGLDAFREDNAQQFFGRQRLVAELVARVGERGLVGVVGPSGSGKSSVVRAGLMPALKAGALPGSDAWRYLGPIVPSSDPLASLARMLVASLGGELTEELAGLRQNPEHLANRVGAGSTPALLVVDQFEEVFTLCDDEGTRRAFIANLIGVVESPTMHPKVVLTMRSDFEAFVARVPELHTAFEQGRVQVTPLSAGELREAIEQPAERIGLKFEAGLVDQLLADILGEPAALPLLQFTLLKLWEQRERNRISLEAYQKVGGGRLALARSADAFYHA
jgi:energy-coupling factor transporter ATP-binding protein EcfA2